MERPTEDPSFVDLAMDDLGGRRITALLDRLDGVVPWEELAGPIRGRGLYRNDTRQGGRPNIPAVVMLRCLFLSKWFGLSDPQMEDQVNDRISFRRFVGLRGQQCAPDETTMVEFRNRLRSAGMFEELFEIAKAALDRQGLIVREGTIVDATIIEQARPRKNKDGEKIASDPDASYTKKAGQIRHGYKMHTAVDVHSGLITGLTFTTAKTHDSTQIDELTSEEQVAVLADSAYADRQRRADLQADGVMDGIAYKRVRGEKELPTWKKRFNRAVAKLRGPGEMPFAWIKRLQGFVRVRYRGLPRNREDALCHAMAFNFRRALPHLK